VVSAASGSSLPPESPYKESPHETTEAVGIPNSNPCRIIANTDENKYEEGYDSDGALGPFYDAVAGEVDIDAFVDDVDLGLPESMGGDGTDAA